MSRDIRIEYKNAFYHVTSRGNTRSRIFKKDEDRKKFLNYLEQLHDKFEIKIHSYCLMSNHYHLLLETPQGNLSKVMHKLNTSYTNYYNYWNHRTGHLFSGRYKAILVEKDSYIQILSAYIHLNPVKAGIVKVPYEYEWSSYKYFYSGCKTPDYMETDLILEYFGKDRKQAIQKYIEFVDDQYHRKVDPFKDVKDKSILGSKEYIDWIKKNAEKNGWIKSVSFSSEQFHDTKAIEKRIRIIVEREQGLTDKQRRKYLVYLLYNNTSLNMVELGKEIGMTKTGIFMILKRLQEKLKENREEKEQLEKMEKKLKREP